MLLEWRNRQEIGKVFEEDWSDIDLWDASEEKKRRRNSLWRDAGEHQSPR